MTFRFPDLPTDSATLTGQDLKLVDSQAMIFSQCWGYSMWLNCCSTAWHLLIKPATPEDVEFHPSYEVSWVSQYSIVTLWCFSNLSHILTVLVKWKEVHDNRFLSFKLQSGYFALPLWAFERFWFPSQQRCRVRDLLLLAKMCDLKKKKSYLRKTTYKKKKPKTFIMGHWIKFLPTPY